MEKTSYTKEEVYLHVKKAKSTDEKIKKLNKIKESISMMIEEENKNLSELNMTTVQMYNVIKETVKVELKDCPICLSSVSDEQYLSHTLCNHFFHDHCIEEWCKQHQTCPCCRSQLDEIHHVAAQQYILGETIMQFLQKK